MIRLAHDLDRRVIAEGIDCPGSLERLRSLACDMGQGYVFAKPMPTDELAGWLGTIPGEPHLPRSVLAATP
jgi:diguanylate cyclase